MSWIDQAIFHVMLQPSYSLVRRLLNKGIRTFPSAYWKGVGEKQAQKGFTRLFLVLSYDCDTDEDAPAAAVLFDDLQKNGCKATFSVPGEQLRRASDVYRRLADKGAFFINHGDRPHSQWDGSRYVSINSYENLTAEEIREDMKRGHEAVVQITGTTPRGFRTPHFGLFQKPDQIRMIHRFARELGYDYSSSTGPAYFLVDSGPHTESSVREYPVSGSYTCPFTILDSWTYVGPHPASSPDVYSPLLVDTVQRLEPSHFCGYLNWYADPSHVYRLPGYAKALRTIREWGVVSGTYEDLMAVEQARPSGRS